MILVDTSAWVEYDRATGSPSDERLASLITGRVDIAATEPVLMEVMAGAKSDRAAAKLRRLLTSFNWISTDSIADFEGAAAVYRKCRAAGITPRGLIDCMVASIAIRSRCTVLAADLDFERMATVLPFDVEKLA